MSSEPVKVYDLTVAEAAARLGVVEEVARRYARTGRIDAYKDPLTNQWRFSSDDIDTINRARGATS